MVSGLICPRTRHHPMNVRKSDDFIADLERQCQWYADNAGWDVAESYLAAVESACRLLGHHPQLGPRGGFTHPRLRDWSICRLRAWIGIMV